MDAHRRWSVWRAALWGYTVVMCEPDLRRVSVLEGLTAEAAAAKLSAGGIAPPLYRHESLGSGHAQGGRHSAGTSAPSRRLRWEVQSILSAAEGVDAVKYSGDMVEKLLDLVRLDHGLGPDEVFDRVSGRMKVARRHFRSPPRNNLACYQHVLFRHC